MKLRMLILAAALLVFTSLSFGQGAQFSFLWADGTGGSVEWYPLTYDCQDPVSPVLHDGTVVRVYKDVDFNGTYTPFVDQPLTIGENGAAGEIFPTNEFVFNSADIGRSQGSFLSPSLQYVGATPAFAPICLVIGEDDGAGGFACGYASRSYLIAPGYSEKIINCPLSGDFPAPGPCWTCCGPLTPPPPDCEGTPSPFEIQTTAGGHGAIPDPDQPEYYCLYLCPGFDLDISIGPLWYDETPVVSVFPGCQEPCNDPDCPPASFGYDPAGWTYIPDPTGGPDGYWVNRIFVETEGCVCLCLEDILAVNLLGFDATAFDSEVKVAWTTASETNVQAFRVMRDGEVAYTVNAGAGSYEFTDVDLDNGRTYTYELVEISVGGNTTIIAETEATPMANLATVTEYALHQNYPNPFNPTTTITFDVLEENLVTLTIYNAVGQQVTTLANNVYGTGRYSVDFSSDNLTSGLYFYTVKMGDEFTATKKMLLVK